MKEKKITFWKHIDELRNHIIHCIIITIANMILLMMNKNFIFDKILFRPSRYNFITYVILRRISLNKFCKNFLSTSFLSNNLSIQNRNIFGQFDSYLWMCFIGGLILSIPFLYYKIWIFINPALSITEKIYFRNILIISFFLFLSGIFFGYFVLCPFLIYFGYSFKISDIPKNIFDLSDYISIIINSTFSMGLMFLFPLLILILKKFELISYNFLKKNRKYSFFILLIIGSAITPGDMLNTIIILIPLFSLYQISIWMIKYF